MKLALLAPLHITISGSLNTSGDMLSTASLVVSHSAPGQDAGSQSIGGLNAFVGCFVGWHPHQKVNAGSTFASGALGSPPVLGSETATIIWHQ